MINTLSASTCELLDAYSNSPVSDVQAENFYFQVNLINCYLREIISFPKNIGIRDWGQSSDVTIFCLVTATATRFRQVTLEIFRLSLGADS